MTAAEFREIALSLAGAVEGMHGGHADFRIGGKVFSSLGSPNDEWAMTRLTPEEQRLFMQANPDAFVPCTGVWGVRGYSNIRLANLTGDGPRGARSGAFERSRLYVIGSAFT